MVRQLELSRVVEKDGARCVAEMLVLPVNSGKDPLALLIEAAEDLCLVKDADGVERIAASDVKPFVIPRLEELLDPENDELRFVLTAGSGEKVSEHAVKRAIAKGVWPTSGSVTLEAAVLAVKLAELAHSAVLSGGSLEIRMGDPDGLI